MVIKVLSIIFILAGTLLLIFAFSAYRSKSAFITTASPADGVVVETIRRSVSSRTGPHTKYYYKIRYETAAAGSVEAIPDEGHNSPDYKVGDRVQILYDPANRKHIAINTFSMLWFNVALLGVLGGYLLAVGLCNLWITARPVPHIRTEVKLRELGAALRDGKLKRDSEYQGLLVAFSFVGFAFLAVAVLAMFFSTTTKIILGSLLLYAFGRVLWGRKKKPAG
jgi:hypothetical protein